MKLNRFNYLMTQGVKNIFTHGFMSFASITIIIACLLIMGSFSLLTLNIDANIDRLQNQNEVIAYVDETLSEDEARAIEPQVAAVPNVATVEFVTREQAMQTFEAEYDSDLFDNIDASVFRHRYVVTLDDLSLMKDTQAALKNVDGIADVDRAPGLRGKLYYVPEHCERCLRRFDRDPYRGVPVYYDQHHQAGHVRPA